MKTFCYVLFISAVAFASGLKAQTQDTIQWHTGRTVACDIERITADSLFFVVRQAEKKRHTYTTMSKVAQYHIGALQTIQASLDTSAFYQLTLDDGTELNGKIRSIQGPRIQLDDQMLNLITVKAEVIKKVHKQSTDAYYKIELASGKTLFGSIEKRSKKEIQVKTESLGLVTLKSVNVKELSEIEKSHVKKGEYWFPNPNTTRYFFGPTAMNLAPGEGYYQNAYIIGNSVNYGMTQNFSMGGIAILPLVVGITPKFGFEVTHNLHLGGGAIAGFAIEASAMGIVYGVATYGTIEHNLTLGTGMAFFDEELYERPIITVSAMTRLSRRSAIVTENWILPAKEGTYNEQRGQYTYKNVYNPWLSYGVRWMINERITFDFALINNKDIFSEVVLGVPYIDFVYRF